MQRFSKGCGDGPGDRRRGRRSGSGSSVFHPRQRGVAPLAGSGAGLPRPEFATAFAGALRQHGTAQQGRASIKAAKRIADHPAATPGAGIGRPVLGLHIQGNGPELVAAVPQPVAVGALQHQETALANHNPPAWLGGLGRIVEFELLNGAVGLGIAELDPHQAPPPPTASGLAAEGGCRWEKPQPNRAATESSTNHSGTKRLGKPIRTSRRMPTSPTAR